MPKVVLTDSETDSAVLDDKYWGRYQVVCTKYGSSPVVLQIRDPDQSLTESPWTTARYNNTDIEWGAVGDVLDLDFTENLHYRLHTTTAGAVMSMDKHG